MAYQSCIDKTVKYEPSLLLSCFNSVHQLQALEILEFHGLKTFVSKLPEYFLDKPVREFYESLHRDSDDGCYYAEVTVYTNREAIESSPCRFNVTEALRKTFGLPHEDALPLMLNEEAAAKQTQAAAIEGKHTMGTVKAVHLQEKYKILIKVMMKCWFGKIGSTDQLALPQKSMLAALMQPRKFNWELAYLRLLMEEKAPISVED